MDASLEWELLQIQQATLEKIASRDAWKVISVVWHLKKKGYPVYFIRKDAKESLIRMMITRQQELNMPTEELVDNALTVGAAWQAFCSMSESEQSELLSDMEWDFRSQDDD
jgi:hypothetical protein